MLVDRDGRVRRSLDGDGSAESIRAALGRLSGGERELRLELRRPTLDDAFISLTERRDEEVAA